MRYQLHELAHRRWAIVDIEKDQILFICSRKDVALRALKRLLTGGKW